jgi:hypothetical protein
LKLNKATKKGLFFALYPALFYGCWYYLFSQISHINEDCFQHAAPSRDWAVHQVASSLDWGVSHPFWKANKHSSLLFFHQLFR